MQKRWYANCRFVLVILVLLSSACSQDPNLQLSRDFLDAYFVMADHEAALKISSGQAMEQIQKEQELLKNISASSNADSYRSRDITFKLERQSQETGQINYLYRLKIIVPDLGTQEKLVMITVDTATHKVKAFTSM